MDNGYVIKIVEMLENFVLDIGKLSNWLVSPFFTYGGISFSPLSFMSITGFIFFTTIAISLWLLRG